MMDAKIFEELCANEMFDTCINYDDLATFRNNFFGITFYVEDDADIIYFETDHSCVNCDAFLFIVEAYKIFSEAFGKDRMYWFN